MRKLLIVTLVPLCFFGCGGDGSPNIASIRNQVYATDPASFDSLDFTGGTNSPCTLEKEGYRASFTRGGVEYVVLDSCDRKGLFVLVGPTEYSYAVDEDRPTVEDALRSFKIWLDEQSEKQREV